MKREEIEEKLTAIFREVFVEPTLVINDSMTADDVESWDSLSHMLMVTKVESDFGVKFKLKDLNKMKNVGDLISLIESKLA